MTATVAGWITYAAARGDTIADDADSAAALVRASDYITYTYVSRFGSVVTVDADVIDAATYEAAKLELATPGFWSKTFTPDQQKVLVQVGDIKWQARGEASGTMGATPVSTKIEAMLRPCLVTIAGAYTV